MYDTHVHSFFSHDGKSTIEEYANELQMTNLEGIGFTEHLDFLPEAGGYGLFNYEAYSSAIKEFNNKGYNFKKGIELGYAEHIERDIIDGIKDMEFDYIIGAVHRINGYSLSTKRFYELVLQSDQSCYLLLIEKYYEAIAKSLKFKAFDVIAHIGVYKKWLTQEAANAPKTISLINDMEAELAHLCALSGKVVEVNTSSLFSDAKETMPNYSFIDRYYKCGGRLISISSDAHLAKNLGRGFDEAKIMLKSIGFNYLSLPWNLEMPVKI